VLGIPTRLDWRDFVVAEGRIFATPIMLFPDVALATQVQADQAGVFCNLSVAGLAGCLEHCLQLLSLRIRQSAQQLAQQRFRRISMSRQVIGHCEAALRG
jgi:hypothetical protein